MTNTEYEQTIKYLRERKAATSFPPTYDESAERYQAAGEHAEYEGAAH